MAALNAPKSDIFPGGEPADHPHEDEFFIVPCPTKAWYIRLHSKKGTKRCPWGTIATSGTHFSKGHFFFLNNHV